MQALSKKKKVIPINKFVVSGRSVELIHGDAISLIPRLTGPFGAVITDPPYSSGASSLSGKQHDTAHKYTATKGACPLPNFEGDSLDQRSWTRWMATWLRDVRGICADGAVLCVFCDWRQIASLTDALQWAGWLWRGVAVWDKINSRPQRGRFRQQSEFIVWGSNGALPADRGVGVLPGVLSYTQQQSGTRLHQTQKPLELMRQIVRICAPGGMIFDPFAGSGSTLIAAAMEGYDAVGCEISTAYFERAMHRLKIAERGEMA
ncbi:MAG: site-specific DNA-methyltransferase [Clostridia bacterium]